MAGTLLLHVQTDPIHMCIHPKMLFMLSFPSFCMQFLSMQPVIHAGT